MTHELFYELSVSERLAIYAELMEDEPTHYDDDQEAEAELNFN